MGADPGNKDTIKRVFGGTQGPDPDYAKSGLSEAEIKIFRAIDSQHQKLPVSLARDVLSTLIKNPTGIAASYLRNEKWDVLLPRDEHFLRDEQGALQPQCDPARALNGLHIAFGGLGQEGGINFFRNDPPADAVKAKVKEMVERSNLTAEAKAQACKHIDSEFSQKIEHLYAMCLKLEEKGFFRQWVSNNFLYEEPLFDHEEDRDLLSLVIKWKLRDYLGSTISQTLPEQMAVINNGVDAMMERIDQHEAGLRQQAQAAAEEEAELIRRGEERVRRNAEKQKQQEDARQAEFMGKPQPYRADAPLARLQEQWRTHAEDPATEWMIGAVQQARDTLDIRSEDRKALGDILLAPLALTRAAHAASLHMGAAAETDISSNIERMAQLVDDKPDAAQALETLLQSNEGTLLVASAILPPAVYADYAKAVVAVQRRAQDVERCRRELGEKYGGSPEDADDLIAHAKPGDPDAQPLRMARERLAQARAMHLDKAHDELLFCIRNTLTSHEPTHVPVRVQCSGQQMDLDPPPLPALPTHETVIVPKPRPGWEEQLDGHFSWQASSKPGHIVIASREFPDIHHDIAPAESEADRTFTTLLGDMTNECEHRRLNDILLEDLKGCGFEHDTRTGTVTHRGYEMNAHLNGKATRNTRALQELMGGFEDRFFQQGAMLDTAQRMGLAIPQDEYMTPAQMEKLQQSMDEKLRSDASKAKALGKATQSRAASDGKQWKPADGKTLLIFDSSSLERLMAPRNAKGDTWLDLIRCTAQLHNVTVVLPAIVADWEMQGCIPEFDKTTGRYTKSRQVDMRFVDSTHKDLYSLAQNIEPLISSATRVRLTGTNGHRQAMLEREGDSNIVIMDTDEDKKFWNTLKRIERDCGADQPRFYGQLHDHIYHHDFGEASISHIAQNVPYPVPMMIVADDKRYFAQAPQTSGKGMPVGQCSAKSYLDAETRSPERVSMLQTMLSESEPPWFTRIEDDIRANLKPKEHLSDVLCPHSRRGFNTKNRTGDDIYGLIDKGVRKAAGLPAKAGDDDTMTPTAPPPHANRPARAWTPNRPQRALTGLEAAFQQIDEEARQRGKTL